MTKKFLQILIIILFLFANLPSTYLNAETLGKLWGAGTRLSTIGGQQLEGSLIQDSGDNYIASWRDNRTDSGDIYAQKFNGNGVAQWTANGVVIVNSANVQLKSVMAPDLSGGAIIAWQDLRTDTGDIYAQRIDSSGNVLWTANGIAIAVTTGTQSLPKIVPDSSGGAIISWIDSRTDSGDVYAQRVDSSGNVQWTANGVVISAAANSQLVQTTSFNNSTMVSDLQGGAIMAWDDTRSGATDIYAQRVDGSGTVQWTANGIVISNATNAQSVRSVKSDNLGGAIILWNDQRTDTNDIYAQRVDGGGNVLWTANGVAVSATTGSQSSENLAVDDVGNSFFSWSDTRSGTSQVYAQKLNLSGTPQWTANGINVFIDTTTSRSSTAILPDNIGGAVIFSTVSISSYAQHLDSSGSMLWNQYGVLLNTNSGISAYLVDAENAIVYIGSFLTNVGFVQKLATVNRNPISNYSDRLSRINEAVDSSHTITFIQPLTTIPHESITITFPVDFTFGASYDFNDVQVAQNNLAICTSGTFTNKTVGAAPSGTTWGVTYSSNTITISAGTDSFTPSRCVRVTLNSNGAGHTITNPTVSSDTLYHVIIDAAGQNGDAAIIILNDAGTPDSDQIEIDAFINTTISLDLDTVTTGCNNNTETSLNTVSLGILTPGTVKKSDTSVKFICIDAGTNAGLGINIFARSNRSNAVGALVSGGNSIDSATADLTLTGVTSGYGIRVSSVGTPNLGSLTINSPFNNATPGSVGALPGILSSAAQIVDSTGPVETGTSSRIAVEVAAKASNLTLPGAYSDIISFTALVNF